jgi:hypothetical protein
MEINESDREVFEIRKNFDAKIPAFVKIAHPIEDKAKLMDIWPVD